MNTEEPADQTARLLAAALESLETLSETQRVDLLSDGHLERLIATIAPRIANETNAYEYLLAHKEGLSLLAQLRLYINNAYSMRGKVDDQEVYISPDARQWFDDGVMFLQGRERFAGLIGLFQDGRVKFAVAARSAQGGEILGKDDFLFVDVEELRQHPPAALASQPLSRQALNELEQLLISRQSSEHLYQDFFGRFPWVLGAQYKSIQSHEALDDRNIPDFTGLRVRDSARDILEIKSPFLQLFKTNGDLAATFNDSWNQTERYLDFCRRESDYLRRQKELHFENPHCYLILGYGLSSDQLQRIRAKERMNPAVTVLTYDDVLALACNTVNFFEQNFGT